MSDLTFLAVHAHPDDEAISTGGTFARLKSEGVRTILVTCTNGEFGDAPGGLKPDHDEHDPDDVARVRRDELEASCRALGVDRLVMLGYRDSGMMGWPQNDDPRSFWATPVDEAAAKLADILSEERPQVIVTYNEYGFYGHPDHIQANRITLAALDRLDYQPTLYYNAIPLSVMARWRERWAEEERQRAEEARARGEEPPMSEDAPPDDDDEDRVEMGTADELIAVTMDVREFSDAKFDSLTAHHSQIGDSSWLKMGRDRFKEAMGVEWFVRARGPVELPASDDLFVGYR